MAGDLTPIYLKELEDAVYPDVEIFDRQVRAHGTKFVHFTVIPCPVGRVDLHDQQRPHDDHEGCSNGMIYTRAGSCKALFLGNSHSKERRVEGTLSSARGNVTFPRTYDEGGDVHLMPFDRLYLDDEGIVVPDWDMIRHAPAGLDRLMRPATKVIDCVDHRGVRWKENQDFTLRQGRIAWSPGRGPIGDPMTGRPAILTVRYLYRPYFYISHLEHEIRIGQERDDQGKLQTVRMQQCASVIREYVHEGSAQRDAQAKTNEPARQAAPPQEG